MLPSLRPLLLTNRCQSHRVLRALCSAPQASADLAGRVLRVQLPSEPEVGLFPFTWLRDNCRCGACFHHPTGQRKLLLRHLDVELRVQSWSFAKDATRLQVTWDDGHRSEYDLQWLQERSFAPQAVARRKEAFAQPLPCPFGPDFSPARFDFEAAMRDDAALLRALWALRRDGLVLLTRSPDEKGVERLAERVAFPMTTTYGVFFDVIAKPDVTNLAYTADTLGVHSDLPYMRQLPGIQVLQCIEQTSGVIGGENQISDGRHAGRLMREQHPEEFELLASEKVRYWTRGNGFLGDYHIVGEHAVLKTDNNGEVAEIVYSDAIRDSLQTIPLERVEPWYRALRTLHDVLMREACWIRLAKGDTLLMDNTRVVHGRSSYRLDAKKTRHLRGCYLPLDETESRMRRLTEELGPPRDD